VNYEKNDFVFEEEYNLDKVSKTTPLSIEIARLMGKIDPDGEMNRDGLALGAVQRAWEEIAGEQINKITRSVYLRKDEVVVTLSAPNWAQELGFFSEEYCQKLNERLGVDILKKVSFRSR